MKYRIEFPSNLGGASSELLMISPMSKLLFQKAVMMSGSALNPWIPTRNEHSPIFYDLGNITNLDNISRFWSLLTRLARILFVNEFHSDFSTFSKFNHILRLDLFSLFSFEK